MYMFTETEMTEPCTVCGNPRNQCKAAQDAKKAGYLVVVPDNSEEVE